MKNHIVHGFAGLCLFLLIQAVAGVPWGYAAGTTLLGIREGLHADYSRLVLDCQGDLPEKIGPARGTSFLLHYGQLKVKADLEKISHGLRGNVRQIDGQGTKSTGDIRLRLATPGVRVKSFVMRPETSDRQRYRLVIDAYPPSDAQRTEKKTVADAPTPAAPVSARPKKSLKAPQPAAAKATQPGSADTPGASMRSTTAHPTPSSAGTPPPAEASGQTEETATDQKQPAAKDSQWTYAGETSLTLRAVDGEDQSSKFDEYSDRSQPVAGDISIKAEKDRRVYANGAAAGIGQDDAAAALGAGRYGQYDLSLSYDRNIHRYAYGVQTLYSGIGSGTMTLDDALQMDVQNAATQVDEANLLSNAMSGATTGDPNVLREQLKLGAKVVAFQPFTLKFEVGHETRQGTRPFAGAFNSLQMVEIFEPIDYETTDMKISGEYTGRNFLLNAAYHYSQFTNHTDTLTFDNPLRATDAAFNPGTGRIDLAPDNQYHNLALTGTVTQLPWNGQIIANAAYGMMLQDDTLVPFTANSAIAAPALPVDSADARVNTSLYYLRLTSRPWSAMHIKAHLRYYDYDNRTKQIDFTNGYVESDAFLTGTAITNLPTSYTKTRAGLDLGFDLPARTTLSIGYTFERTDRENSEVDRQDDGVLKASLDNKGLGWLDLRTGYERTDRKIGTYTYDVYLRSGDDLKQLPQMRKYDQADLIRDRYQVQATVYPTQALSLTGALTYGRDDFKNSPYGLLEDNHLIASFDTDYAVNEHTSLNMFYTFEQYDNTQRGSDAGADWTATGEDKINTLGGGVTLALIPKRLDFNLTYAYSQADGNISFTSTSGSFADFKAVDDAKTHALNTKLKYHFSENLSLSLGYLWEKFDYEDYNTNGFTTVPTDAVGNYQGALLSDTLPHDYNVQIVYTQLILRF
jgi:MtrB/PioB family decaheme-associated outer membrane protein